MRPSTMITPHSSSETAPHQRAANLVVFHRLVFRDVGAWDDRPTPPVAARWCGAVSLLLWGVIIVLGRIIAYFPEPVS